MRIALINPHFPRLNKGGELSIDVSSDYLHPPINIISLASSCMKAGHEAYVWDLNGVSVDPIGFLRKTFNRYNPDIVGLTCLTATEASVLECCRLCSELKLPVVIGGQAAKFNWKKLIKYPNVIAIIDGEGEHSLISLLNALNSGHSYDDIPGLRIPGYDHFLPRKRIEILDEIPFVDFDLIDIDPYVKQESLGLVFSRGCPFNCHFCACQEMWARKITQHSLDYVVSQLQQIIGRYNYKGKLFTFFDDTFSFDRNRIIEFCNILKRLPYNIIWKVMTRVDRVDKELLQIMYSAGCRQVGFGIEVTNDNDMKYLNKGFVINDAKRAIEYANNVGLKTEGFFMIGFPWQQKEDFFRSIDMIRSFNLHSAKLSCLTPYPGTYYGTNLTELGLTVPWEDHSRFNNLLPVVESKRFTLHDQAEAMLYFVKNYVLSYDNIEKSFVETEADNLQSNGADGYVPFCSPIKNEIPKVSPDIVFQDMDENVLAFEFKIGSFAELNQTAVNILKYASQNSNYGELLGVLKREVGEISEADLQETFKLFEEMGFVSYGINEPK